MTPASADLLAAHVTSARARGQAEPTVQMACVVLGLLSDDLGGDLTVATLADLERFLARPGWAQWTRRGYALRIRAFYGWAFEAGRLPSNPAARLRPARPPIDSPHPVTDAELAEALARIREPWRTAVLLAAYAGLRVGDVVALRREDVTESHIRVERGKGGRAAMLPTHPRVWEHVRDRPPGLLMTTRPGRAMTAAYASSRIRAHFDRLGLPDVHLHRFRHWHATTLLRSGANVRVVQELMRHSSLETTAKYLAVSDDELRTAVGAL